MSIEQFRESSLSNQIIKVLVETTETLCELKTLYNTCLYKRLINKAFLINQLCYVNAFYSRDFSYISILNTLASANNLQPIKTQVMNIDEGKALFQNTIDENSILFATDIIDINEAFNNDSCLCNLTAETSPELKSIHLEICDILNDLFSPNSEYPFILETAIALYRLIVMDKKYEINIFIVDLLIQLLLKMDFNFSISKHLIIEGEIKIRSAEGGIRAIINIINNTAKDAMNLIYTVNKKSEQQKMNLQEILPKLYSDKLHVAITQDFTIRNGYFVEYMNISPKTAIYYLKTLESEHFIKSHKIGKEKIYVNNELLSCIKDSLGD